MVVSNFTQKYFGLLFQKWSLGTQESFCKVSDQLDTRLNNYDLISRHTSSINCVNNCTCIFYKASTSPFLKGTASYHRLCARSFSDVSQAPAPQFTSTNSTVHITSSTVHKRQLHSSHHQLHSSQAPAPQFTSQAPQFTSTNSTVHKHQLHSSQAPTPQFTSTHSTVHKHQLHSSQAPVPQFTSTSSTVHNFTVNS